MKSFLIFTLFMKSFELWNFFGQKTQKTHRSSENGFLPENWFLTEEIDLAKDERDYDSDGSNEFWIFLLFLYIKIQNLTSIDIYFALGCISLY